MRMALCNLGCSKNRIDGECMLSRIASAGHTIVDDFSRAETILVNTCAFIREAKEEAIGMILEMASHKKNGACRTLIVCGCFSERYREELVSQFPEVDHWLGVHSWRSEFGKLFPSKPLPGLRRLTCPGPTQYLKISEGCSRNCSFCAIPGIRGPFRSRPYEQIRTEAVWLAEQGTQECVLVSQDSSAYGKDTGSGLLRLVERLLKDTPFRWIRLMYLHPGAIGDSLLRLIASEERICSYLDVPLQHIADPILRSMRRRPLSRGIYALVERIRSLVPDCAIRTAFIVGFPGETSTHFGQLLRFLEWAQLEKVGVFPYSPEEGTDAFGYRPRPRSHTAQRRCEVLMELQHDISSAIGQRRIGRTVQVILDGVGRDKGSADSGRTQWDAPEVDGRVFIRGLLKRPEAFYNVNITGADAYDLYAEPA